METQTRLKTEVECMNEVQHTGKFPKTLSVSRHFLKCNTDTKNVNTHENIIFP